jgi:hypothetical protein
MLKQQNRYGFLLLRALWSLVTLQYDEHLFVLTEQIRRQNDVLWDSIGDTVNVTQLANCNLQCLLLRFRLSYLNCEEWAREFCLSVVVTSWS